MTLGIEQSNDGYFLRFATKDIDVRRTKAKLKTNDNNIDFNMELILSAFWFDGNKQHNSKEIANVSILYLDVPLNEKTEKEELEKYKSISMVSGSSKNSF